MLCYIFILFYFVQGEIYDAVASICPDSKDDHGRESYREQETMAELMPQNQMDISQSVREFPTYCLMCTTLHVTYILYMLEMTQINGNA